MNPIDLLTKFEELTEVELQSLVSVINYIKSQSQSAVLTANAAEARINTALLKDPANLPNGMTYQGTLIPTYFGAFAPVGTAPRGTNFIFGQYGFLGYENNADGSSFIVDPVYGSLAGQNLSEIEVVNRRTLHRELALIQIRFSGTYLSKINNDEASAGITYRIPNVIVTESLLYDTLPAYETFTDLSLINVGYFNERIAADIAPNFSNYLPLSGGTLTGDLLINQGLVVTDPDIGNTNSVVIRSQLGGLLDVDPNIATLKVMTPPTQVDDVVRLGDLLGNIVPSPNTSYPVWTSGKIDLDSDLNASKARSPYSFSLIDIDNQSKGAFYGKILKLSAHASHNSSDTNFLSQFAQSRIDVIEGTNVGVIPTTLPLPVDYTLFLEYTVSVPSMSGVMFTASGSNRVRVPLDQSDHLKYSAFIDKDGDLALLIQTNGIIPAPWDNNFINILGNDTHNPLLYLVVNRWSYSPTYSEYLSYTSIHPSFFVPASTTFYGAPFDREMPLYLSGVDWSRSVSLQFTVDTAHSSVGASVSAGVGNKTFITHLTATSQQIVFSISATFYDVGGSLRTIVSSSITVANLPTTSIAPLVISNGNINVDAWDGVPNGAAIPFAFTPIVTGGAAPYSWSVTGETNVSAVYSRITGRFEGTFDGTMSPANLTIHVVDALSATLSKTIVFNLTDHNI